MLPYRDAVKDSLGELSFMLARFSQGAAGPKSVGAAARF